MARRGIWLLLEAYKINIYILCYSNAFERIKISKRRGELG
jgi:hypothetical protein